MDLISAISLSVGFIHLEVCSYVTFAVPSTFKFSTVPMVTQTQIYADNGCRYVVKCSRIGLYTRNASQSLVMNVSWWNMQYLSDTDTSLYTSKCPRWTLCPCTRDFNWWNFVHAWVSVSKRQVPLYLSQRWYCCHTWKKIMIIKHTKSIASSWTSCWLLFNNRRKKFLDLIQKINVFESYWCRVM